MSTVESLPSQRLVAKTEGNLDTAPAIRELKMVVLQCTESLTSLITRMHVMGVLGLDAA